MLKTRFTVSLGFCACSAFIVAWCSSHNAYAQGRPAASSSVSNSGSASASASVSALISSASETSAASNTGRQVPFPPAPIYVTLGGLTADKAAQTAIITSKTAKVDEEGLKAAAALVDAAVANYVPRLGVMMRATRLSDLPSTSLGTILATSPSAAATVGPTGAADPAAIANGSFPIVPYNLSFPVPNQQYIFELSLTVPISDYLLRIYQTHQAALDNEDAAKWGLEVTKEGVATDARVYFYNLLRAHALVNIAKSAVDQTKAHQKDVRSLFAVKRATNADVARMDYQIEAANLVVIQSENYVSITEANLRLLLHADADSAITLGEDLETELPPFSAQLKDLREAATANRPELKALDAQIRSLKRQQNVAEASYYPQIAGFAHFDYANPAMRGFQSFSQT
jgi:outer membrane protein TolC